MSIDRFVPWLRRRLPAPVFELVQRVYHLRPAHREYLVEREKESQALTAVESRVRELVGSEQVQAGPMNGMRLRRQTVWGHDYAARLLGTYELELHSHLLRLVTDETSLVVDVGSADGYYAVGLARLAPRAEVRAYDIDEDARLATRALAVDNAVSDRVKTMSRCRSADLMELPLGSVVVMDCEGAEARLVTPAVAAANQGSVFIIECHEHLLPGIAAELQELFVERSTQLVWPRRRLGDEVSGLPADLAAVALDERRSLLNPWLIVE